MTFTRLIVSAASIATALGIAPALAQAQGHIKIFDRQMPMAAERDRAASPAVQAGEQHLQAKLHNALIASHSASGSDKSPMESESRKLSAGGVATPARFDAFLKVETVDGERSGGNRAASASQVQAPVVSPRSSGVNGMSSTLVNVRSGPVPSAPAIRR